MLTTIPEPLRDHPKDVPEVVGDMVAGFVAGTVALLFAHRGIAPEILRNALLHDAADLAAGRIAFEADGQVPETLATQEVEALFGQGGGLSLDVLILGMEGDGIVFHGSFVLVPMMSLHK